MEKQQTDTEEFLLELVMILQKTNEHLAFIGKQLAHIAGHVKETKDKND